MTRKEKNKRFLLEALGRSSQTVANELVKTQLQNLVRKMVLTGQIADQDELDHAFDVIDMAAKALRMIPFNAWKTM